MAPRGHLSESAVDYFWPRLWLRRWSFHQTWFYFTRSIRARSISEPLVTGQCTMCQILNIFASNVRKGCRLIPYCRPLYVVPSWWLVIMRWSGRYFDTMRFRYFQEKRMVETRQSEMVRFEVDGTHPGRSEGSVIYDLLATRIGSRIAPKPVIFVLCKSD